MVSSFFIATILIVGVVAFAFAIEEAHAINKIKGYVSEAKERERQAELAKQNQTESEDVEFVNSEGKRCNPNNPICVVEDVVDELVDIIIDPDKYEPRAYANIIGLQLSKTCQTMERNNVTSNCPTNKDLWQFDNTMKDVSGDLENVNGYWERGDSPYKDHCNFYQHGFPVMIVVDPDGCWQRERGIKMITIHATTPENLVYKLKADKETIDEIRELSKEQSKSITSRTSLENKVDNLEDAIDNKESLIKNYEDDIDRPRCDDDRKTECNTSLQSRNLKFKLKFAVEDLAELKEDLIEAKADYLEATGNVTRTREGLDVLALGTSSKSMIGGYTSLGVGRFVDNCREASVGSNMTLITDTINYLLTNCKETNFVSIKTTHKEQTPINISEFKEYKFREWLAEAKERCKVKC